MNSRTIFFVCLFLRPVALSPRPLPWLVALRSASRWSIRSALESHSLAKLLLQASVVALGFGMNLKQVVHAGRSGFFYTAISITCAMLLGLLFGGLLKVAGKASFLISAGTAICGGSAIAAISPITGADEEEISVSMGTVFLLNSVALLIFPAIGHAPALEPESVRTLVRAGHSRHQFRGGSCRKVRQPGARGGHHGEAGTRPLDRSRVVACGGIYGESRDTPTSRPRSRFPGSSSCSVLRLRPPHISRGSLLNMAR